MSKIKIIIATQHKKAEDTIIRKSMLKLKQLYPHKIVPVYFLENKIGLGELYQTQLEKCEKDIDYLLFVHDDLAIYDSFFMEKLDEGFKHAGVVGLAGSTIINMRGTKLAWHNCRREHVRGTVGHPYINDNYQTFYNTFGVCGPGADVACIDGLFIGLNMKVCRGKTLFSPLFKWDFYDFSFSVLCAFEGIKINIPGLICKHFSHGEGLRNDNYDKTQKIFLKWFKETQEKYKEAKGGA